MTRVLLAAVLLAAAPPNSRADDAAVRFTVRPMPAPKPALRYQLLPESAELSPGNAAQGYLLCFMEQRNFFFGKEAVAERARFLAMPLAELPAGQLKGYGGSALRHADWAARLDAVDWQYLPSSRGGDMGDVPGELGQLQILAAALQVRFRAEVAGRRYDDAIRTAKTMFALSRHMGEHPTLIGDLVGIAIAAVAIGPLEEMLEQPVPAPLPLQAVGRGVDLPERQGQERGALVPLDLELVFLAQQDELRGREPADQALGITHVDEATLRVADPIRVLGEGLQPALELAPDVARRLALLFAMETQHDRQVAHELIDVGFRHGSVVSEQLQFARD